MLSPFYVGGPKTLTCEGFSPIWDTARTVRTSPRKHKLKDSLHLLPAGPSVFPGTERTGTERSGSETPPYSTERTKGQSTARTVAGRALKKGELKLS